MTWFTTLNPGTTDQAPGRWIVRLTPEAVSTAPSVAAAAELLQLSAIPVEVLRGLGLPGQLVVASALETSVVTAALANSWPEFLKQGRAFEDINGEHLAVDGNGYADDLFRLANWL